MTSPEPNASLSHEQRRTAQASLTRRHLLIGWWSLVVCSILGVALEVFHGFKLDLYVNVTQETRRLMWTLAHAHGTLLSLVHIAFAVTLTAMDVSDRRWAQIASVLLTTGGILLPAGFLLGGLMTFDGDPGLGIILVPLGAICVVSAFTITAAGISRKP